MHTPSITRLLTFSAALAVAAATTHAAIITWGPATTISGDADVSTAGTLVNAVNIGAAGVGSTTVNGVTFDPLAFGNNVTSGNFNITTTGVFNSFNNRTPPSGPFLSLSAPYKALLSSVGLTGGTTFTLTMSGLAVGANYEFEWWSNVSTGAASLTGAFAGVVVALNSRTGGVGGLGQFAVGTFTADGPTQAVLFNGPGSNYLNAAQLRQTSVVPEPGTAFFGLALCGVAGLRRRR